MDVRAVERPVAVVTGASGVVGGAVARALSERGHPVALIARGVDRLEDEVSAILAADGLAKAFGHDLALPEEGRLAVDAIRRWGGDPLILVNAAGTIGPLGSLSDVDPDEWAATFAINTVAPMLLCRAALPGMLRAGWGRIVNVSSASSLTGPAPGNGAYEASKSALNLATRCLAASVAGTGVTANLLHPGEIKSGMSDEIRRRALAAGPAGEHYLRWSEWLDQTGGDLPRKSADVVLDLLRDGVATNGEFLWIADPLRSPFTPWIDPETDPPPWA